MYKRQALNEGIFAVGILIVCSFLGYLMKLAGFNPVATVLGFVLAHSFSFRFLLGLS